MGIAYHIDSISRWYSVYEALAVTPVGSHNYQAYFPDDWCIGSVPHGGYVTSVMMRVAAVHFSTTLRKQNQPNPIIVHMEFLRRTQAGPASFQVHDIKIGRAMSNIHITLTQGGREEVMACITNSNFELEAGPSYPTGWSLHPAPCPVDLSKLQDDQDLHWEREGNAPFKEFRKAANKVHMHLPRKKHPAKNVRDEWISFTNGERFNNDSIGYVCDAFPQMLEGFQDKPGRYWYPTMVLNLEIKKSLPAEGLPWLFVRIQAKQIKNGRMNLEIVILDDAGDIVALSNHVVGVLDASRNLAPRTGSDSKLSKI